MLFSMLQQLSGDLGLLVSSLSRVSLLEGLPASGALLLSAFAFELRGWPMALGLLT